METGRQRSPADRTECVSSPWLLWAQHMPPPVVLLDFVLKWLKNAHTCHSPFVSVREVKTSTGLVREQESSIFDFQSPSFHFTFFLWRKKNPKHQNLPFYLGNPKYWDRCNLVQIFAFLTWGTLKTFSSLLQEVNTSASLWFLWASNGTLNPLNFFCAFFQLPLPSITIITTITNLFLNDILTLCPCSSLFFSRPLLERRIVIQESRTYFLHTVLLQNHVMSPSLPV